jgi:ferritin-like metal-binding protein YciE
VHVPEVNTRDLKLIQYLNEAYGTEKQLEVALEAHIAMTARASYRKRLRQHLSETKRHAHEVDRRIRALGGRAETVSLPGPDGLTDAAQAAQGLVGRAAAAAQGPLHALRGTGEDERQLKNAKTEYASEAEEIATYSAIETLAESVGDRATAKLAKAIRREEERMAGFLERLIPQLTKAVAHAEIPAAERNGAGGRRRRRARSQASRRASGGGGRSTTRKRSASRQ